MANFFFVSLFSLRTSSRWTRTPSNPAAAKSAVLSGFWAKKADTEHKGSDGDRTITFKRGSRVLRNSSLASGTDRRPKMATQRYEAAVEVGESERRLQGW